MGHRTAIAPSTARTSLLACAIAAFLLLAPSAEAATPAHARHKASDLTGLNHACGVATDNQGDLYLASAGTGEVKVFNSAHTELTSIPDVNEPCALAVQTDGTLYVSEKATGKVVRFEPTAYPFLGTPTYGSREVIDSSGLAKGISVDPFDNRLYVAEGSRVTAYDSEGHLGTNETQTVRCFGCTGGTYKLKFGLEETEPIPFEGPAAEVEAKLLALNAFEPGDVSVVNGTNAKIHLVTFTGKYAHEDVAAFGCNPSIEGGGSQECKIEETAKGFSGHIGEGQLTEATGVAPYTYKANEPQVTYRLAVADASEDQVKLFSALGNEGVAFKSQKLRRTLSGPAEGEEFGFGPQGAYLTTDRGTCPPTGEAACTAGHFLLYDEGHEEIEEFEADGALVSRTPFAFPDGGPTALAVERSAKAGNGTLYATSGTGAGAKALAFSPLPRPERPGPEAALSLTQPGACSVAIDEYGDRYVAVGAEAFVYPPTGSTGTKPLVKVPLGEKSCRIAVDAEGDVYALLKEKVVYLKPSSFPPTEATTYAPVTVAEQSEFSASALSNLALDPANGHLFVTNGKQVFEYKAAKEGSALLNKEIGAGLGIPNIFSLGVYGANGDIYLATSGGSGNVFVLDPSGKEILIRITGQGSPAGSFGASAGAIAVDQSNGHVIAFETGRKDLEEYEASGTFLAAFGSFESLVTDSFGVAIDNGAHSPNRGTAYLAYDDPKATYDLTAFGGLAYPPPVEEGEKPAVLTGAADEYGPEGATLHGTVNPRAAALEECRFEYLTQSEYESNGETFAGAEAKQCAQSPEEIGEGNSPVEVDARVEGLAQETAYRYRLVATNEFGESEGEALSFILKAPVLSASIAQPVSYGEATLHGSVDPAGSPTTYRFQYLTQASYEAGGESFAGAQSTPAEELPAGEGAVEVTAPLTGLADGTEYRFRLVAHNGVGEAAAEGPAFTTLTRPPAGGCANAVFRTGASANLPDCRAYELVTPPETNGYKPAWGVGDAQNSTFPTPLAAAGGGSAVFETEGPLPGTEGNGVLNGYRAERGESGWNITLYGPIYPQTGFPDAGGVSADQGYSFWRMDGETGRLDPEEGVSYANYLALPEAGADPACGPEPGGRFELIGCGSAGTDPEAIGRWISPGAGHVVFTSSAHLEPEASAKGTTAIYDRSPGGETHVVSLLPGDLTPSGAASYRGVSADGSAVAFALGGALYVRRNDTQTFEVTTGSEGFAGLSREGAYLFYVKGGALYRFDLATETSTQIASGGGAAFVNVAANGTRAYFTSTEALAEGAQAGEDNLYLWEADGSLTRFVAVLAPGDVSGGQPSNGPCIEINLARWVEGLNPSANGDCTGPAIDPSRSTPDGRVLVFQSIAPLTGYDSAGHTEVFRFEAGGEGSLVCLSCGALGTTAGSNAELQDEAAGSSPIISALAPIANLSADGKTVFFSSEDQLLPGDANQVNDVYEWRNGVLSLISSGQDDKPSYLYAASGSGDDVFFYTLEKLVGEDVPGSASLYDARVNGGFPEAANEEPCQGDACQGAGTPAPALATPASAAGSGDGNLTAGQPKPRCPKGRRLVRRGGKSRCVAANHRKRRASHNRRPHR